jgi:hypothetical protein
MAFHFLGTDEDSILSGTVIVRDGEMVLEILGGEGPYLIVGKARKHWFEGPNSAVGRRNQVDAKWTEVCGTYVGIWIEENWKYLFSFELGSPA